MKKIILLLTCIIAGLTSFAQTDPLREKLDSIFQYIDKSQIPTGYLKEYGSEFLPLHYFNGLLTDSNTVDDLDMFRTVYADMYTAKLPELPINPQVFVALPGTLPPLPQVNDQIDTIRLGAASSVVLLYGHYASLKPTALDENLFSLSNEQLYDVAGRPSSPYVYNTVFAAAAIGRSYINTVSLRYDASLYYSNTAVGITTLSIDFLDGNGYQTITTVGISKTYADSTGYKPVIFKALMNNGAILYCHSKLPVKVTVSNLARYTDTDPLAREIPIRTLTANSGAYNHAQDILQIRYAKDNPTRGFPEAQRLVRKPLIYVEGYDPANSNDIFSLIKNQIGQQKGEWILLNENLNYDFINDLDDVAGYDFIYVNHNTLRSITNNALMLREIIYWANEQKAQASSTEKNVVLGVSAGGLVARYCLADMTKNIGFNSTDTKILITHDSPHQGSNIPLSLQHFLYDLAYTKVLGKRILDTQEKLKEFVQLNNAPSTADLLRARVVDENNNVVFNTFLTGIASPYQQMVNLTPAQRPYKFVATAQGSQCGVPVLNGSNITFAGQDAPFTKLLVPFPIWFGKKYWLNTTLKSLPATGNARIEDYKMTVRTSVFQIGFGWKNVKEAHRDNPANFNDWDGVPGSTQSIAHRTKGALTEGLLLISGQAPLPEPYVIIVGGLSMTIYKDLFSFVSTTSALDATPGISPYTPFNSAFTGNANTATDKFIAQESQGNKYNINHTDYTARNAKWIFNEMQNTPQSGIQCGDICNGPSISGIDPLCTSSAYTVLNIPTAATISWSVSPSNIVSLSTSGNTVTVTRLADGTVTLTATITNGCPGSPSVITKSIVVGKPYATQIGYTVDGQQYPMLAVYPGSSPNEICLYKRAYPLITFGNATSVLWSRTASASNIPWDNYNHSFYFFSQGQWLNLTSTATNGCGSTSVYGNFQGKDCTGGIDPCGLDRYIISPNPSTSGYVAIDVDPTIPPPCDKTGAESKLITSITDVRIYDISGTLRKFKKVNKAAKVSLDTHGLLPGTYRVHISDGIYKEIHTLIINR